MAKTLYLRNVPDDVAERLERLAKQAGMSTSAFAVRELTQRARVAENAAILAALPAYEVDRQATLDALHEGRGAR